MSPRDQQLPHSLRPYDARMLSVGQGHWLFIEQVGNPKGFPALFLHGGPGSGAQHMHRHIFDPDRHRAILFDQRGAGRSHPYLSRDANTTQHLVDDIERIREHLGIDRWVIAGGSWGSTLALAYAQQVPERVAALVLRAVFLGTAKEVEWAFAGAARAFRPELYEDFVSRLPEDERANPVAAYAHRISHPDKTIHYPAAQAWNTFERALSELQPGVSSLPEPNLSGRLPPTAVIEAHYVRNNFFLQPNQLLNNAAKLRGIPGAIIQGRYDLLCPPVSAYALAKAWPEARLQFVETAGHSMTEADVTERMREAVAALTPA